MAKFSKVALTPEYEFRLTLNEEEIRVLLTIFHRVGGAPEGYRGVVDGVKCALMESKLKDLPETVFQPKTQYLSNNIYFRDTK